MHAYTHIYGSALRRSRRQKQCHEFHILIVVCRKITYMTVNAEVTKFLLKMYLIFRERLTGEKINNSLHV